ncbi:MAG: prephenate/arogenate dehydrogenase family protein [Hellea sp.]|nr:prephenate/arogenate dehydrogenase family protein [Hellea sp.]
MTVYYSVLIIGGGLIGSSMARAIKSRNLAERIHIADASADACKVLEDLGVANSVSTDFNNKIGTADLVVLATPPGVMDEIAPDVVKAMKTGAVLTDVGSTKLGLVKLLAPNMRSDIHFIPGHPIAGTENSGPAAGFADLFEERWCILTPVEGTDEEEVTRLSSLWEAMGSQIATMDPERHDMVLATTSHVPHLIAYTLVGTAMDMETVTRNDVVKYSAGGFRDFTRIAASDPEMWRDVFLHNKDGVLEVVDRFIEDLSALKRAIRWGDGDTLLEHFSKTRDIRRRIIDAGQDTEKPDFGREG